MKRTFYILLGLLLVSAASGLYLYSWLLKESKEASVPITATALSETMIHAPSEDIQREILQTLEISQNVSEARFIIFEELRGEPVDVVGATDQVAGQLRLNLNDLSQTELGIITINARTFITDADKRNRAIRNRILHTDDHEFITFTPTRLTGLSGSAEIGSTLNFSAEGDLAIRDVVQPVIFEIAMEIVASDRIQGEAETTVSRKAFDLKVPDLPFLANVADEIRLEFNGEFHPVSTEPEMETETEL